MDSYPVRARIRPPLDIDDTCDGRPPGPTAAPRCSTLIMTNAAFLPIHVYDTGEEPAPWRSCLRAR